MWDTTSRRILYKLPGHAGSVNELAFHPEEPISKYSPNQVIWGNRFRAGCMLVFHKTAQILLVAQTPSIKELGERSPLQPGAKPWAEQWGSTCGPG